MARTGNNYEKWLWGDNSTNMHYCGYWVLPFLLIAIYLYTKFYFNANSSFKVICQTRYWTDGLTNGRTKGQGDSYLPYLNIVCTGE